MGKDFAVLIALIEGESDQKQVLCIRIDRFNNNKYCDRYTNSLALWIKTIFLSSILQPYT